MMPGKRRSPARSLRTRLSRISCFTGRNRADCPRNAPRVWMEAAIPAILSDVHHPFFARAPLVFAHRGGSALAPENTLAAFDRGAALGAGGLELDVHLSRDGVVVVHHDRRLERTTNLQGAVADHTADVLARADAGYHFSVNGDFSFR